MHAHIPIHPLCNQFNPLAHGPSRYFRVLAATVMMLATSVLLQACLRPHFSAQVMSLTRSRRTNSSTTQGFTPPLLDAVESTIPLHVGIRIALPLPKTTSNACTCACMYVWQVERVRVQGRKCEMHVQCSMSHLKADNVTKLAVYWHLLYA